MDADGLKQWKCEHGHILGVVQRVKTEGFHVSRLMLFRHAINLSDGGTMQEADVIATVEGTTLDAKCDVPQCGAIRTWYISEDVVRKIVRTYFAE